VHSRILRAVAKPPAPVRVAKKSYTPPEPSTDSRPLTYEERQDALCLQIGDPEIFFAEKGAGYRAAETICARCPIAARCLAAAIEQDEQYGFFAASPPVRERIRERMDKERAADDRDLWAGEAA
jgi:hypothetical protein